MQSAQSVHVGFNNMVDMEKMVAILGNLSANPTKKLIERARSRGTLVEMTAGHKAKSVIVASDGRIILISMLSETIAKRLNNYWEGIDGSEKSEEEPRSNSGRQRKAKGLLERKQPAVKGVKLLKAAEALD